MLVLPQMIALDSSHYAEIAKDTVSGNKVRRNKAKSFLDQMANDGFLLFFCFSHLEELLRNENDGIVNEYVSFLSSLPLVAWTSGYCAPKTIGSVVDLLSFEAKTAFDIPEASPIEIRGIVAEKIFQCGSGREMIEPFTEQWRILRNWLAQRNAQSRETASIYKSGFAGKSNLKVKDLLRLPLKSAQERDSQFRILEIALETDIKLRGDKRISDPADVSRRFLCVVRQEAARAQDGDVHPLIHILNVHDIEQDEIDDSTTLDDIGNIAIFRSKLRIANQNLQLPWARLKRLVTENRVPSGVIQMGLRRFGQELAERKGSDLGDTYLACLAPYAEVTYVDKRTLENISRARRKQPGFEAIIRRVEKAGHYTAIPAQLAALHTS